MINELNELIEQIGGRERLEAFSAGHYCPIFECRNIARALLMVLDAQGSTVGCASCGGNGAVVIDHGEMSVEHMECPKCFKDRQRPARHDCSSASAGR